MNPMIGALQKRVQHLTETIAIQKLTFDRLLSDLEMTESMGCAFAWELSQTMGTWINGAYYSCPPNPKLVNQNFVKALEAGAAFQEARQWLRDKMRTDKTWRKTAIEAAGKNPDMDIETPHGSYSLRLLTAT